MARQHVPQNQHRGPFICYSRKDETFVRRLFDLLASRGRDAWVDWDDIPPTAEWMSKIHAGIDSAPAVIVVLSPDALASRVCAEELRYAVAQSKRLIPLVCRTVEAGEVPEPLRRLNWIPILNGAIEDKFNDILATMDMDLAWVDAHARLLTRAGEWSERERDPSLLLRGAELASYEEHLAGLDATLSPQPTALQRQFLLASRQSQTRRQRVTMAGVTLAFAGTAVLAVIAFSQWRSAEHQRNTALSRLLAAQALTNLYEASGRLDIGLLQSVAAMQFDQTIEARESLWRGLLQANRVKKFLRADGTLLSVAVSPDGRTIVTGGRNLLQFWDAGTFQVRPTPGAPGVEGSGPAALAFSPDGTALAVGIPGGVELRDPGTGMVRRILGTGSEERTTRIAWHPGGKQIIAASNNEESIVVLDIDGGGQTNKLGPHRGGVRDMAISPDGGTLASIGDLEGQVGLWDLRSGSGRLGLAGHPRVVRSVAFSPDGGVVASGNGDSTILLHDAKTGAVLQTLTGQAGRIDRLAFSPNRRWLASGSDNRTVYLWDLQSGAPPEALLGHDNGLMDLAFSPDSRWLLSAAFSGTFIAWEIAEPRMLARLGSHEGEVLSIAVSQDGSRIATGGEDRVIRLWSPEGSAPALLEGHKGAVLALAFSPDGTLLASGGDDDSHIRVWDVAGGRPTRDIEVSGDVSAIGISPDGSLLASVSENLSAIQLWNLATGELRTELKGHEGSIATLAFSRDGKLLVSGGGTDQTVRIWDVASGAEIVEPRQTGAVVSQVAFTPDGSGFASAGSTFGELLLWDSYGDDSPRVLQTANTGGNRFAFSADGPMLAYTSGEFRSGITLWDSQQSSLAALLKTNATVLALAFMPNGRQLVAGHSNGDVVLWNVDFSRWPQYACEIANRDLTPEEWRSSLGEGIPFRAVCPSPVGK